MTHSAVSYPSGPSGAEPERRTTFGTEKEAREHLEDLIGRWFRLVPEVRMTHLDGTKLRIDYIAVPRPELQFPAPFVGIELKRGYSQFRDFSKALKQCVDYRHSVIADARSTKSQGMTPPFVFLYPPLAGENEQSVYAGMEAGAVRFAGQFNVGILRESRSYWSPEPVIRFEIAATRLWSNNYGANALGDAFGSGRRRGSA